MEYVWSFAYYQLCQKPSGRAYGTFPDEILRRSHCGAESGSMGTKINAAPGLYHALLTRKRPGNITSSWMRSDPTRVRSESWDTTNATSCTAAVSEFEFAPTERVDQRKTRTLVGHDRRVPCTPCQP